VQLQRVIRDLNITTKTPLKKTLNRQKKAVELDAFPPNISHCFIWNFTEDRALILTLFDHRALEWNVVVHVVEA